MDKVKAEQYTDIEQLSDDIEAIINDVKGAFKEEETEFRDANELYEFFLDVKQDVCYQEISVEETSSTTVPELVVTEPKEERIEPSGEPMDAEEQASTVDDGEPNYELESNLEELIQEISEATDSDGRSISAMFQILPPKSKFKDYYELIQEPIDIKTIEGKHRNHEYRSLNDLEKDLLLMVRNARTYNKPGSQIYKDANTLKKMITSKKAELEQKKVQPVKSSNRIKAKRSSSSKFNKSFEDSPNASLNHEDSLADDNANDSAMEEDEDDPMYKVYEFVRSYKNANDVRLSDPFMRLPNKRYYPDYYTEIKRPTTLGKIKSKICAKQYANLNEMLDELNVMFKNALKYNKSDSQIYKDAQELQRQCFAKAKEYTDYEPTNDDISIESEEEDEEEEEEEEEEEPLTKKTASTPYRYKKSLNQSASLNTSYDSKKSVVKPPTEVELLLRRRFRQLYKSLLNYSDEEGRYPIDLFMELPSKKDYPDYFQVIKNPIDMKTIDANIKSDRYSSEDELLKDFKLMFDNCREYNEDGSQIYMDADQLEAALYRKIAELDGVGGKQSKKQKIARINKSVYEKIRALFENVLNYKDENGRKLSKMFMKLPSKSEYPAYYEVIKKPIDLDKIGMKIKNGVYESLEEILSDLVLSFDNACKFNEPDSQIYKDSLTLQNFAIQNKLEMVESGTDGIPDVGTLVQDLLTNLFTSVYGHIDEEGRCYSESLLEIIDPNLKSDPDAAALGSSAAAGSEEPTTFEAIKRCLQKNKYRRLDRFQSDMFAIFERVRKTCRTDSQAFEDSIDMQQFFISLRNELCKNGERLQSPALNYTEADLNASVENLKQEKLPFEPDADECGDEKESSSSAPLNIQTTSVTGEQTIGGDQSSVQDLIEIKFNDIQFRIGDYVYVEPKEKNLEPHIIHIQRIYKDENGDFNVYGTWFYRPNETFHLTSRRFLENEVFRSDNVNSMLLTQVIGKCCVMFVKDYFRQRPKGFDDRDVFVCESKYFTKAKQFKKIKYDWNVTPNFELEPREEELPMNRVPSVFKNRQQDRSSDDMEVDEDDQNSTILDVLRVNVKCDAPEGADETCTYYEQYVTPSIAIKQDDYCYVEEDDRLAIYQVDRIFVDKDGAAFVQGPLVVKQSELDNSVKQASFYPQEVFLTSQEATFPIGKIKSKCAVLSYKDYITKRPTEIAENDVYICESKYDAERKTLTKLPGGLTGRLIRNPNIVNDEYYGFRKLLQLLKKEGDSVPEKPTFLSSVKKNTSLSNFDILPSSPMSTSTAQPSSETENEESNDVTISNFGNESQQSLPTTPAPKKVKVHRRIITGYILFASEVRKQVCLANPERNFGDISRIIGQEWKNLPIDTKSEYERKAQKHNESTKAEARMQAEIEKEAAREASFGGGSPIVDNLVYECQWEKCNHQFEDANDLLEHFTHEPTGHVWRHYGHLKDQEGAVFQCLIKGCTRVKKGGQ